MSSFTAQIKAFATRAVENAETVLKESAQEVFSIAQTTVAQGGRMPVDTGDLRNSFTSTLNGGGATEGPDAYTLTIAQMELGDSLFGGWGTDYALRMEYGFVGTDAAGRTYNQAGNFFMGGAASQWQAIVTKYAAQIKDS